MCFRKAMLLAALALAGSATGVRAGGSGLNVAVVVNAASTNSVQLGNYYCAARGVPPQNLLRIHWTGGNIEWSKADFETRLFDPLTHLLDARGLSNQVETVVLSMDIPYRVFVPGAFPTSGVNSTTSALFYGFKPDTVSPEPNYPSCSLPPDSANGYAGSELPFRSVTNGNAWLAFMITAGDLASAKAIVDRGVLSDGAFPTQRVLLTKSTDTARNVRYLLFDDAILDNLVLGQVRVVWTNTQTPAQLGLQLGSQSGWWSFPIAMPTNLFVPGAMADNLTSYGGQLFENSGHTGVTNFLAAGATASYGTLVEPCNWLQKFPSPHTYFFQARGFSIAECYYQSLPNPFQGILVGEPLAAPFAANASGAWLGLPDGAVLRGMTNLAVQFTATDTSRPVQQVDLFLDGTFWQTVTNLAPQPGNVLSVTIAGHAIPYIVPAGATLATAASGLVDALNAEANTNATGVLAFARGDRIELQSFELGRAADAITLSASGTNGGAAACTTFIAPARTNFVATGARGRRSFTVRNAVQDDSYLQLLVTKTNGDTITLSVTNSPGNTNPAPLVEALVNTVNANVSLLQPDGLVAEDFVYGESGAEFNLRSRTVGWPEAQLTVALTGSTNLDITPTNALKLDENLNDLRPRNHLYVTAGATNLPVMFALNTTALADGWHELTAVAYEGSHVRTQKRISQHVRVANTPLGATFTALVGGSNTLVTTALRFAVAANTNTIARLELFSTGGLLASVTNQAAATFSVAGTNLDLGLHPFHAVVTRDDGQQYRTETQWIRLLGADFDEPPFNVTVTAPPPALSWPAIVGRTYTVLSAVNLGDLFQIRAAFTATNSPASWAETNGAEAVRFYRVRSLP